MVKKLIRLAESELREVIQDSVSRIIEGIDVDLDGNVTITDKHECLVDTSVSNNPTVLTELVPNVKVWSIFQRKDDEWFDGNPLLYALKNEKNYKLTNPRKFYNRLEEIDNKFFGENNF